MSYKFHPMNAGVWLCQLPVEATVNDLSMDHGTIRWHNKSGNVFEYASLPFVPEHSPNWAYSVIDERQMRGNYWQFLTGIFLNSDYNLINKGTHFIELILIP